jgi:hypothetical protein
MTGLAMRSAVAAQLRRQQKLFVVLEPEAADRFPGSRAGVAVIRGVSNFRSATKQRAFVVAALERLTARHRGPPFVHSEMASISRMSRVHLACLMSGAEAGFPVMAWDVNRIGGKVTLTCGPRDRGIASRPEGDLNADDPELIYVDADGRQLSTVGGSYLRTDGRVRRGSANIVLLCAGPGSAAEIETCRDRATDLVLEWCGGADVRTLSPALAEWQQPIEL